MEADLHLYVTPEAKVWIPDPFLPKEIVIPAISMFILLLDVKNWKVIFEARVWIPEPILSKMIVILLFQSLTHS